MLSGGFDRGQGRPKSLYPAGAITGLHARPIRIRDGCSSLTSRKTTMSSPMQAGSEVGMWATRGDGEERGAGTGKCSGRGA